jgi:hypothetical protein
LRSLLLRRGKRSSLFEVDVDMSIGIVVTTN